MVVCCVTALIMLYHSQRLKNKKTFLAQAEANIQTKVGDANRQARCSCLVCLMPYALPQIIKMLASGCARG